MIAVLNKTPGISPQGVRVQYASYSPPKCWRNKFSLRAYPRDEHRDDHRREHDAQRRAERQAPPRRGDEQTQIAWMANNAVDAGRDQPRSRLDGDHAAPRYLRALAIRYSASASIGPPLSARSRRTSSRTARRMSSGNAASAWPLEPPPRSKGP
jgi:hypothetical protein